MTALRDRQSGTTGLDARVHLAPANDAAELNLPFVLQEVAEAAQLLLAASHASIGVLAGNGQLQHFVHAGLPAAEAFALTGQPPLGPDILGVPIKLGDGVLGNLYVTERTDGAEFSAQDKRLAEALAVSAGRAIASVALLSESERRRRWLVASGELTNLLLDIDRQQPLSLVTQHAATGADADFVILELPHGDDHVRVAAVSGGVQAGLAGRTTSIEASAAGQTIFTGRPTLVENPDLNGRFALYADSGPQLVVPLTAGEHTLGALTLGRTADRPPFTEIDLDMAASFATQAAVALELADARDTQLRLNREEDHDRIAADLHDHVIQELFALGMGLQGLASITKQPAQLSRITSYVDMLDKVIGTIRRTIFQLQPTDHDPIGLRSRILDIATEHTAQLGYSPHIRFAGALDAGVDEGLAVDVLAVIRECISNCARHAHATRLEISIALKAGELVLKITDNGRGLGAPTRSSGLSNIRHRAEDHDGTLTVTTPAQGGTMLTWSVTARTRPAA